MGYCFTFKLKESDFHALKVGGSTILKMKKQIWQKSNNREDG